LASCTPYLRRELEIVAPILLIGFGQDAAHVLTSMYPQARQLDWPFRVPHTVGGEHGSAGGHALSLLCPPHPSWVRRQNDAVRDFYVRGLAHAVQWAFALDARRNES
jgi:uracil-DNA glycosylase